jgi:hypothetical protein
MTQDNSTSALVLAALEKYGLKYEGDHTYRCHSSPFRNGSDSDSFVVTINDQEHGAWYDHVSSECGSLYDLAEHLGITLKQAEISICTKRTYNSLDDYASAHGVPGDVFRAAGWKETEKSGRPALEYLTTTGPRWRFLDGNKPVFISPSGYKRCWYGLERAGSMAQKDGQPLVICNGEPSVIAAQHWGVPACAVTGGEHKEIPILLFDELREVWQGEILIAPDCDDTGAQFAEGRRAQLSETGYKIRVVNLNGGKGYDLADFCALYQNQSMARLLENIVETAVKTFADLDDILSPIVWEWRQWQAKGLLTLIVSMSGEGKTCVALRICGCYLLKLPWPDGTLFTGETGSVVWCEAEAFQAGNLERANKWGYPLDKILIPLDNPLDDFKLDNPTHKGRLTGLAYLPDVKLIVVDSLSGANSRGKEKDTEILPMVQWLAALARDTNKPIMLTHHLRKRGLFDTEEISLDRVRGSSAIIQPARLVWALDTPDPNAKNWKRLSVIKSNLARIPEPIGLTIDDEGVKFGLAPEPPKVETVTDKAADLLIALLSDEPMRATDIESEFKQAGISWKTANIAKKKLGISAIRKTDGWYWSLLPRD